MTAAASAAEPKRAGPDWWALQPLARPAGAVSIDSFVRAKLATAGLKPAPPTDHLTLIRRATFDLTGLPPTPAEIDAFLADKSANAYATLLDRLLASPAYGERWARHWLDIVRFSESHGFEYDRLRDHAWPYRDYVIRALNADKPYVDFVREQLAGDVLPGATVDGTIATGMLVAGPYDQAGNSSASPIVRGKAREDELEDLTGTVGQTFLGITLNCARCHDHKFDPYSAADYYRFKAVFAGVFAGDRPAMSPAEMEKQQAAARTVEKRLKEQQERLVTLERTARERLGKRDPQPDANLPRPIARWAFDADGRDDLGGLLATPRNGARIANGRLIVDGKTAFAETTPLARDLSAKTLEAWVALPTLDQGGGGVIGVQAATGHAFDSIVFAERTPRRWVAGSEGFVRTRDLDASDESAKPGELVHVATTYAADGRITVYRNGRQYGPSYLPTGTNGPATFKAKDARVIFGLRHTGGGKPFLTGEIEEARLYDRALSPDEVRASFRGGVDRVSTEDLKRALTDVERLEYATADGEVARMQSELARLRRPRLAYTVNPKAPGPTPLLKRGDVEKPGELMTPGSPAVVTGVPPVSLPPDAADADRRRAFAEWVVHRDNPLTWRVIVNRVWQHHFGDGLVRTPNDFGLSGERPTHPELLDWLAAEFRSGGGSLKALHKRIMLSETYRQASTFDPKAADQDAENRLLWRYAPRRLEAEAVRDAMLAVSGKLNPEAGGPSTRPFRIETFNSAFYILFDEDKPEFNRRSIYRMNVTSARDPLLEVLDCPDPSVKTPRRTATTTPLQALTMMNGSFTNRLATAFADRLKREAGGDVAAQVALAYRLAFGRPATAAERDRAAVTATEADLKAVCWAIFNASEFVYVK